MNALVCVCLYCAWQQCGVDVALTVQLGGITIAEMQADLEGHGISVNSHEDINIYQSSKVLAISGSGFRTGDPLVTLA